MEGSQDLFASPGSKDAEGAIQAYPFLTQLGLLAETGNFSNFNLGRMKLSGPKDRQVRTLGSRTPGF